MKYLSHASWRATDAIVAGTIGGTFEFARVQTSADSVGVLDSLVLLGLAVGGATTLAAVVQLLCSAMLHLRPIHRSYTALQSGKLNRGVLAWRVVLIVAATLLFGVVTAWVATILHEHFRFHEGARAGVLIACVAAAMGVGVFAICALIDRRVTAFLRMHPHVIGRRAATALLIGLATVAILLPVVVAAYAAPEANRDPVGLLSTTIVAATGVRLIDPRQRWLRSTAGVIAACIVASPFLIAQSPPARGAALAFGAQSKLAAKLLWRLGDRDSDGFAPSWLGGADCDDNDPRTNPAARDVMNNGIDENCSGGDARPSGAGQTAPPRDVTPDTPQRNVILISVDTLRADHLGAWGYSRATSPAIDKFAASAMRFANAYTTSPTTRYAIPSLLGGRYASRVREPASTTLAETLKASGWSTTAVLCCQNILPTRELRGFDDVVVNPELLRLKRKGQSNADAVTTAAIERLKLSSVRPSEPFFLWVHFYDPHHPYHAPSGPPSFGGSDIARYDAEIAFADREIGRLLSFIDESGMSTTTVVALTADHGEEFGEHGLRFHARSLFNQVIRIPLIIRSPLGPPGVVPQPVSLADVMPTLLDLAGSQIPGGLNGQSLAAAVRGTGAAPTRPILVELLGAGWHNRNLVAAISTSSKVLWDREANLWSAYDTGDVDDVRNRVPDYSSPPDALKTMLGELLDRELSTSATGAR